MYHPKKPVPSYSSIAWWLAPLAALVFLVLYQLGKNNMDTPALLSTRVLSADMELITLGESHPENVESSELAEYFIPPVNQIKQRMLDELRVFRSDYRQMAPSIAVSAIAGSPASEQVANELASIFAKVAMGRTADKDLSVAKPAGIEPGLMLFSRKENQQIIHQLLAAMSHYISGSVLVIFKEDKGLGRLLMVVSGSPQFRYNGVVVFPELYHQETMN